MLKEESRATKKIMFLNAAPVQHCGQSALSSFKSSVCVCLIALLPQSRQRQGDGREDSDGEGQRERDRERSEQFPLELWKKESWDKVK